MGMTALLAKLAPVVKPFAPVAKKLFLKKVTKEVGRALDDIPSIGSNEDGQIIEIVDTVESYVIDKKKAGGWSTIAIALAYFGAGQGWFGPEVAQLIDTLLSNPEVVEVIESAVE